MQNFEVLIKAAGDYGLAFVIAVIFLWFLIQGMNLIFQFIKDKMNIKGYNDLIDKRDMVSIEIQHLLDKTLKDVNGQRIFILEFTNSVANLSKLPYKYMECSYESYRPGSTSGAHYMAKLSASLYTVFTNNLEERPYLVLDVNKRDPNLARAAYEIFAAMDERLSMSVLIRDLTDRGIGIISLCKIDGFDTITLDTIRGVAKQLGILLGQGKRRKEKVK